MDRYLNCLENLLENPSFFMMQLASSIALIVLAFLFLKFLLWLLSRHIESEKTTR
ncbi:hypothetical protein [Suicoccus acidiformans]|uniref:hypothetical protein n=1 Tax=Suicoccus acidiformans TaxID=2036206 RepID=UPI0013C35504|nr:hypothetical protein [Suicoccus acidiformans]